MTDTPVEDSRPPRRRPAPAPAPARRTAPRWRAVPMWRRGRVPAALGLLTALALGDHRLVPGLGLGLGSLWESALPWSGLVAVAALLCAALRRAPVAACAGGVLAVVWAVVFGPVLLSGGPAPTGGGAGGPGLTVVTHNVNAANPDPAGTARALLAAGPDLVALEEVTDAALPAYRDVLERTLPHHARTGTVALWSRYPVTESRRLVIDPGWNRSLRAEVSAPGGPLAVYVAHLASVRAGVTGFATAHRDRDIAALARALDAEPLRRVLLLGDLNTAADDRALAPLTSRLTVARGESGSGVGFGFGFSWPAALPLVRIDHVLTRGLAATATATWTLPATPSDHRPVAARLSA
ncbi:endonuclease/exonuclease/phosphatase family protein [Kitasatospora sp. NPDC048286]|uniref:endonuclease/exonuclease/phosphatase family protein n=1 Tax=Kitasatospora sp. NPDC048286 TaxID=3364047 RepID=UPI00371C950F